MKILLKNGREITLTDEDLREAAEVKADLIDRDARRAKLDTTIAEERERIAKIPQPSVELKTSTERVVYFLSLDNYVGEDKKDEFVTRVLRGLYTAMWNLGEWQEVVKPLILLIGGEIGESATAAALVCEVERFPSYSEAKREKLLVSSFDNDRLYLPTELVTKNTNKL